MPSLPGIGGPATGGKERPMPLARYFMYVGSVLLALLFVADAWLPKPPARIHADVFRPVILIYSDRNWPERVVYNTSLPAPSPDRGSYTPAPERFADQPVKQREAPAKLREAFAALPSSDAKAVRQVKSAKQISRPLHMHRTIQRIPRAMFAMAQRPFGSRFVRMW